MIHILTIAESDVVKLVECTYAWKRLGKKVDDAETDLIVKVTMHPPSENDGTPRLWALEVWKHSPAPARRVAMKRMVRDFEPRSRSTSFGFVKHGKEIAAVGDGEVVGFENVDCDKGLFAI